MLSPSCSRITPWLQRIKLFSSADRWQFRWITLAEIEYGIQAKSWGSFADAWIAAAAVQLNIPLVTHNASDFRAVENLTILTAAAPIQ